MDVLGWAAEPAVIQRIPPYPTSLRTSKPRVPRDHHMPSALATASSRSRSSGSLAIPSSLPRPNGFLRPIVLPSQVIQVLGPDHLDTLRTRSNLASFLGEAGRVDEAVGSCRALLEDHHRVLGSDHHATLTTRCNLAFWLGEAGRVDEAVTEFRALLASGRRPRGVPDLAHLQCPPLQEPRGAIRIERPGDFLDRLREHLAALPE
jgi:hypothetical protein